MPSKPDSDSFKRWRLDNADKVLQYKRTYYHKNKDESHNRYVWRVAASRFRNILVDQ